MVSMQSADDSQAEDESNTEKYKNMKRPNITPGEWTACIGHAGERFNIECRGTHNDLDPVATCKGSDRKANAVAIAAVPELLAALEEAQEFIQTARQYFPKSIKNADRFKLELTSASVSKALTKAGYEFP